MGRSDCALVSFEHPISRALFPDHEGEEFASEIKLEQQVLETAQGLIRIRSLMIPDGLDCTLEVTDSAGKIVFKLPFGEAVQAA